MKIISVALNEDVFIQGKNIGKVKFKISRVRSMKGIEFFFDAPKEISIHKEEYIQEVNELEKKLEILKRRHKKRRK